MELVPIQQNRNEVNKPGLNNTPVLGNQLVMVNKPQFESKPFIEANTSQIQTDFLAHGCIIPVFSKDNEKTISHQEFIEMAHSSISDIFHGELIEKPEVRVSHIVKGRTPNAIHKIVKELLPEDETIYYERMAFIIRIPSIIEDVHGNKLSLMVGGVRAYSQSQLYGKKSIEKFKAFIGFQNMVCCNLCISTDGYQEEIRVSDTFELRDRLFELFNRFEAQKSLSQYQFLGEQQLTESQFAQMIGRCKLYNFLSDGTKMTIPRLEMNDRQISTVARDYYQDESFCRDENGNINLWRLYNLFTSANKSSYIDSFGARNVNAYQFTQSISEALKNNHDHWFLT